MERVITHNGEEFRFRFTRRRYGRTTFTWAEVHNGDHWLDLGDPWPCTNPPKEQLIAAALYRRNPDDRAAQDEFVTAFATT